MNVSMLPMVNAALNGVATVCLLMGRIAIGRRQVDRHKAWMIAALAASAVFLTSYLIYHAQAGSTPYPRQDWTRPVYFAVLIPHIILAALMVPFILAAVYHAFRGRFDRHTRITRWLWPVWMYVSVTGVIIYLMLYHLPAT